MSKVIKIWLIVASSLVVAGIIIFGAVMTIFNWDFTKLGTSDYETNRYEIEESFRDLSIDTNTADITVLPSEDGEVKVVCKEKSKLKYSVSVENDTLIVFVSQSSQQSAQIISVGHVQKRSGFIKQDDRCLLR